MTASRMSELFGIAMWFCTGELRCRSILQQPPHRNSDAFPRFPLEMKSFVARELRISETQSEHVGPEAEQRPQRPRDEHLIEDTCQYTEGQGVIHTVFQRCDAALRDKNMLVMPHAIRTLVLRGGKRPRRIPSDNARAPANRQRAEAGTTLDARVLGQHRSG